jgi:hypothetical protein
MKIMPDTVSSVCGNGDGFTYCPHTVYFTTTGGTQINFDSTPGIIWNSATSELKINPALALTKDFKAVVSIAGSSPLVTITQLISWAVLPTATVPTAPAAPTTAISGTNVVINWVAPADGGSAITGY